MATRLVNVLRTGNVATTDATPTNITGAAFDCSSIAEIGNAAANNVVFHAELTILAVSGSNYARAKVSRMFKRNSGTLSKNSTLELIAAGAAGVLIGDSALLTAVADLDVSGNTIVPKVTGIAATNINFYAVMSVTSSDF